MSLPANHARLALLAVPLLLLFPATAHACGACLDGLMLKRAWGWGLPGPLVMLLLTDFFVVRLTLRRLRDTELPPLRWHFWLAPLAPVAAIGIAGPLYMGSLVVMKVALAAGLGLLAVLAAIALGTQAPRLLAARTALLAVGVGAITFGAYPQNRTDAELVTVAIRYPLGRRALEVSTPTWVEQELGRRGQAGTTAVEDRLREARPPSESFENDRVEELLRIHERLGGSAEHCGQECARLELDEADVCRR